VNKHKDRLLRMMELGAKDRSQKCYVSLKALIRNDACTTMRDTFALKFGLRVEVTPGNIRKAMKEGLNVTWLFSRLNVWWRRNDDPIGSMQDFGHWPSHYLNRVGWGSSTRLHERRLTDILRGAIIQLRSRRR